MWTWKEHPTESLRNFIKNTDVQIRTRLLMHESFPLKRLPVLTLQPDLPCLSRTWWWALSHTSALVSRPWTHLQVGWPWEYSPEPWYLQHAMPFTSRGALHSVIPEHAASPATIENLDPCLYLNIYHSFSLLHGVWIFIRNPSTRDPLFHT